jgi:hypothetical protein
VTLPDLYDDHTRAGLSDAARWWLEQLAAIGEPYDDPKTQAETQALAREVRAELDRLGMIEARARSASRRGGRAHQPSVERWIVTGDNEK